LHRRFKTGIYVLEGLNAFGTTYFFFYLFFLLRDHFGFGNIGNLGVSAMHGFIYFFASWQGGRFAQKFGYFNALYLGFIVMLVSNLAAWGLDFSLTAQLVCLASWTIGLCFIWPTLEALVSENEVASTLPRMIGIYNVVWAGVSAVAFFLGGAIYQKLGGSSLYWLPAGVLVIQIALVRWLHPQPGAGMQAATRTGTPVHEPEQTAFHQRIGPEVFLRMAWLANPFAYIASNTVIPIIPSLAQNLDLSPAQGGAFCSIWFFVRLGTFILLWRWTGWHYHFRWLAWAFVALIAGFSTLLLAHQMWLLVVAQVLLGYAVGLLYYSSLFYSMDVGETKGEHGGLHEAAIGAGICIGPSVGMTAMILVPGIPNAGIYAVGGLLTVGLATLMSLRYRAGRRGARFTA
jgi:predicted MFS family arabinose efflux permease